MGHIFLSHSTANKKIVERLNRELEKAGLTTWFDVHSIRDGQAWPDEIEQGIEACDVLVLIWSAEADKSEWVQREVLFAQQLGRPVITCYLDATRLPIYVINRQAIDFRKKGAFARLLKALGSAPAAQPATPDPTEKNFFKFMRQSPDGDTAARIAQDLYRWARKNADVVEFGGRANPGFHARVQVEGAPVTVFSVWAHSRQPSAEVTFQQLKHVPPYDEAQHRLTMLDALNQLMPAPFPDDKADKRPSLPLAAVLAHGDHLAQFKAILAEIIDNLRDGG